MPIQIDDYGKIIELPLGNHLLRSTEVTELISSKPSFIVRWGVTMLSFIALLLLLVTWFIKYPDIVSSKGILNSVNAPQPVVSNTTGKLVKLLIKEGDEVTDSSVLAFIESTAGHRYVIELSANLHNMEAILEKNRPELLSELFATSYNNLGELQPKYQVFKQAFLSFTSYLHSGFYLKKKAMLFRDRSNLQKLHANLLVQRTIREQDLALAQRTFDANDTLRGEKVISELEYRNEKSKLLNKSLSLPQLDAATILNESQQNDKQKEIMELENTIAQQKTIFEQALNTFKSEVDEWKKKYLLIASTSGKVSFATFVQENQQLKAGQVICYINPNNSLYYAEMYIPQSNFGKIKTGQKVLLKFPAYPYAEFGSVEGRIDFISRIATDSGYLAKVNLPNGLTTDYSKPIQFREGLIANGEIITENMRLLERFYRDLIKNIKY